MLEIYSNAGIRMGIMHGIICHVGRIFIFWITIRAFRARSRQIAAHRECLWQVGFHTHECNLHGLLITTHNHNNRPGPPGRPPLFSLTVACNNFFVYTSGHCRRWRSRMEVKIMAGSLFVHCKIAYIYLVTAEKWLVVSLPNFVMIRMTHLPISCKIFSWIRTTKLKIHAMEFCDFIKDSVSPSGLFVPCSLTVTITWRPRLTAHCPIRERH